MNPVTQHHFLSNVTFKKSGAGFTLIELLVVISIIGLLASVALVSLNSARAKARDARRIADKKQMITALNLYYSANNTWPASVGGGYWSCLAPSSESCWGGQYTGLDSLVTAVQPYVASFPKNNADSGTRAFDRLIYIDNTPANTAGGPNSPAGAYITWMQEQTMSSAICPGNIYQYDKYWYCHENVGSP